MGVINGGRACYSEDCIAQGLEGAEAHGWL